MFSSSTHAPLLGPHLRAQLANTLNDGGNLPYEFIVSSDDSIEWKPQVLISQLEGAETSVYITDWLIDRYPFATASLKFLPDCTWIARMERVQRKGTFGRQQEPDAKVSLDGSIIASDIQHVPRNLFYSADDQLQMTKDKLKQYRLALQVADQEVRSLNDTLRKVMSVKEKDHGEMDILRRELELLRNIAADRNRLIEENRSLKAELAKVLRERDENTEVSRVLLSDTHLSSTFDILETLDALNRDIDAVSSFLAQNIAHTRYELFQQELNSSHAHIRSIFGERLANIIIAPPSEGEHRFKTANQFFLKCVFKIFMVGFCGSEVNLDKMGDEELSNSKKTTSISTAQSGGPIPGNDPKSTYLQQLSNLFKAASWAIPGAEKRFAFEESLRPFFHSLSKLKSFQEAVHMSGIILSTVGAAQLFDHESMQQVFADETLSDRSASSSHSGEIVAGAVAIGMIKQNMTGTEGHSTSHSVRLAKVVLFSSLERDIQLGSVSNIDGLTNSGINHAQEDGLGSGDS